MKKILSYILLILLISAMTSCAYNDENGQDSTGETGDNGTTDAETSEEASERDPMEYTDGLCFSLINDSICGVWGYLGNDPDIVIPEYYEGRKVTYISRLGTFRNELIDSVYIPNTVETIQTNAFSFLESLKCLNIPASVTSIEDYVFNGCVSLESITVDEDNPVYRSEGNCLIERETERVILGCKTSIVPEGVKIIGRYAFEGCKDLRQIILPESLVEIEENAFGKCENLESVVIKGEIEAIGSRAFEDCRKLESVVLPESMKDIGYNAFARCYELSQINFPDGLLKIRTYAFYNTGIESVVIPESLESLEERAFESSVNLKRVEILADIDSMHMAFQGCHLLESISIPASAERIEDNEFFDCWRLKDIYYGGSCEQWEQITAKSIAWLGSELDVTVHCSDGDILLRAQESESGGGY